MTVNELKLLLNLYPDNLEVVVPVEDYEFDAPALQVLQIITCTKDGTKFYFEDDGDLEDDEKFEEVLLIN
jgi:hypothetical protein